MELYLYHEHKLCNGSPICCVDHSNRCAIVFISDVRSNANTTMDAHVYVPSIYHARCLFSRHFTLMLIYRHTYSMSMDQPGKVANAARGQLNKENEYFPVRARA